MEFVSYPTKKADLGTTVDQLLEAWDLALDIRSANSIPLPVSGKLSSLWITGFVTLRFFLFVTPNMSPRRKKA